MSLYDRYSIDVDVELMNELLDTYGWLFKPLEPFGSFNNMSRFDDEDISRLDYCNEMLLEYLKDHVHEYDDASEIPDRKLIVHVAEKLRDREGIKTKQTIYQWMTPHVRLECADMQQTMSGYTLMTIRKRYKKHHKRHGKMGLQMRMNV